MKKVTLFCVSAALAALTVAPVWAGAPERASRTLRTDARNHAASVWTAPGHTHGESRHFRPRRDKGRPHAHKPRQARPPVAPLGAELALVVTNTNDSGAGSLRDAIDQANANPGSTITFSLPNPSTITLTSGDFNIWDDMTITGPGPDRLTIDADGDGRIFDVNDGTVAISGLTLYDGWSSSPGGGIYNETTLTLTNCRITDCGSDYEGGGVFNDGTMTLVDCRVDMNYSFEDGGGLLNSGDGMMTILNSRVEGNFSYYTGGGICNWDRLVIRDSSVTNNEAGASGGGLEDIGWALEITNSTFSGNDAYEDGGGLDLEGPDEFFAGSAALIVSPPVLTNVTIADNGCFYYGGGVWGDHLDYEPTLLNCIVGDNYAYYWGSDFYGTFQSDGHVLLEDDEDDSFDGGPGPTDIVWQDPMLDPLALNGGTTFTHALQFGSPALDAGDDGVTGAPWNFTHDQRGVPRLRGNHVDIGAYESGPFLNIYDDFGSSQLCMDRTTGAFQWDILTGWYAPMTTTGTLQVMNGGTQFWSNYGDPYYLYCTYDPINHTGWAYFFDYSTYSYAMIWDSNTTDNPPCGGGERVPTDQRK